MTAALFQITDISDLILFGDSTQDWGILCLHLGNPSPKESKINWYIWGKILDGREGC